MHTAVPRGHAIIPKGHATIVRGRAAIPEVCATTHMGVQCSIFSRSTTIPRGHAIIPEGHETISRGCATFYREHAIASYSQLFVNE